MIRRALLTVLTVVLVALLALTAAVVWIGGTQSGTQWLTQQITTLLPDTVSVERVSGRLFSPLQLDTVTVNAGGSRIELKHITLEWQPSALLRGDVRILRFVAEGVTVLLPPPTAEKPAAEPPRPISVPALQLPLAIQLLDLRVSEIAIAKAEAPDTPIYTADNLRAAAALDAAGIHIDMLQLRSSLFDLHAEGSLASEEKRQLQLDAQAALRLPDQPPVEAQAQIRGPLSDLALQLNFNAPAHAALAGTVRGLTVAVIPEWTLRLELANTALNAVKPDWPDVTVAANLDASGAGAQQARATVHLTAQRQDLNVAMSAETAWDGDTVSLSPLTLTLPEHDAVATLRGNIKPLAGAPAGDLALTWNNLRWPLTDAPQVTSPQGEVQWRGTVDDYQFHLATDVDTAQFPQTVVTASGTGSTAQLLLTQLDVHTGSTQLSAAARVGWREGVHFAGAGQWKALRWPLTDIATVTSDSGHFHAAGTPEAFALAVDGDLAARNAPPLTLELGAVGHADRIDIARLYGEVLGGTLNAAGQVQWREGLRWQAQLAAEHINFAQWRDLPASDLALRLRSHGAMTSQSPPEIFAELEQLSGHLAQQPVDAHARVTLAQNAIKFEPVRLRVGASNATIEGNLGETVNLRWTLRARELQALDKRLAGDIDAQGTVEGFRAAPHVKLTLSGSQLRAMQARIDRIDLDATATLAVQSIDRARLMLHSTGLAYGEYRIDQLVVRAQGDGTRQNAVLALTGGEHGAAFTVSGAAQGQAWEGAIDSGIVAWAPDLTWRPTSPAKLRVAPGRMHLDKVCWTSEQGSVCAAGEHAAQGHWRIALRAPELGLALLQRWMPPQITLAGTIDAGLNAEGSAGGITQAKAQVQFEDATFTSDTPGGAPMEIQFSDARIQANLDDATLDVTAGMKLNPGGTLQARATMPAPALFANPMAAPIDAQAEVKLQQIDALGALLPGVTDVHGRVDLNAALTGTLQTPQLKGRFDLASASLKVPAAGLDINDIELGARAKSVEDITFTGGARSGDGRVSLSGSAGMGGDGFALRARLQGENFTAIDTRELRALLSPDITLATSVEGTTITGTVLVPEATIRVKKPKGAVQASTDVVVIEERSETPAAPHRIAMQVRVELGERVNMDAFNLRAALGGAAQINMEPAKPPTAVGTFRIDEGFYEAWGVALRIEHGRVVYVNSPLSNPGLDIRATRKAGDVVAGLNVTGTVADPKIEVFSDPPMNESDAFSYLIFGRPMSQSTSDSAQGYDAVNAARSMGLEIAAQRLSQKLGLEDVRVQTDEEGNSTVVMGRYLSPKIYVGYGVDMVEQITSIHLDYLLSRRWTVRTQTSAAATAADLLFTLETD